MTTRAAAQRDRVEGRRLAPWMLAGMLAFVPHLLAVVIAGLQRPGFSHRLQYLSELGERGSATAGLTNYLGIVPTGLLLACFGLGLFVRFRTTRPLAVAGLLIALHGGLRVAAALFPCDPGCRPAVPSTSQTVHNLAATAAFVTVTLALFIGAAWLRARRRGTAIVAATYLLGIAAVVAQAVLAAGFLGTPGLFQRLALGALQLWVALLAWHLWRAPAEAGVGR